MREPRTGVEETKSKGNEDDNKKKEKEKQKVKAKSLLGQKDDGRDRGADVMREG